MTAIEVEEKQIPNDRRIELKIKIKDLTAESRSIRREEERAKAMARGGNARRARLPDDATVEARRMYREDLIAEKVRRRAKVSEERRHYCMALVERLQLHRRKELRRYARVNHLAYAFIRGVPYKAVEQKIKVKELAEGGVPVMNEPDWPEVADLAHRFLRPVVAAYSSRDTRSRADIGVAVEAWASVV